MNWPLGMSFKARARAVCPRSRCKACTVAKQRITQDVDASGTSNGIQTNFKQDQTSKIMQLNAIDTFQHCQSHLSQALLGRHARCPRLLASAAAGAGLWFGQQETVHFMFFAFSFDPRKSLCVTMRQQHIQTYR